jgi:carboxypeptidase family protein
MGRVCRWMLVVISVLALPGVGLAQEATISGTVADSTGAVVPGATIIAVHEVTGNTFEAVTDERGGYRIPVRVGAYRMTAQLPGFATVVRSGLQVLVGQTAVVDLQMVPSALQETVTVTGEAPLVDVSSSQLGGNIDPRQMQELPVLGRNFLDLTLLAPGNRANHTDPGGLPVTTALGTVQLNVDGMQVTNNCCGGSNRQPSFGRDAIAEFQFISNRFDATQGRSSGAQVNVITKSGTNMVSGSFSGYFRHDSLNAADFIQQRVLPYSNQQFSTTFGGPIRRDRVHYFFSYEFEREPSTVTHNTPYPAFNVDLESIRKQHKPNLRVDAQLSAATRLSVSSYIWRDFQPIDGTQATIGGAINHPSNAISFDKYAEAVSGTLTRVLSNRAVNETKVGWAANWWRMEPSVAWNSSTLNAARNPVANEMQYPPVITLRGFNIGGGTNFPQFIGQDVYTLRDDLTFSMNAGGRHDIRTGGEYLNYNTWHDWCNFLRGNLIADNGPVPANIEQLFPVWNDPSTWNLAALSPISREFRTSFGPCNIRSPRHIFAVWFQDDWQPTSRLTVNLGVRYDVETDTFANELGVEPFLPANRPLDTDNAVPRLGFAYSLNDRTVIRGGGGKYFAWLVNQVAHPIRFANTQRVLSALYDGRADFAVNPWNGPLPRAEDLEQIFCNVNLVPGCIRRALGQTIVPANAESPYSYQASVGVQRQVGDTMGLTVDYSFNGQRKDRISGYNINLSFNPATGLNYPFSDLARRPYPAWGQVPMDIFDGNSNYHGVEMSFTKRMSNRWQASGTYTVSAFRDGQPAPWSGVMNPVAFTVLSPLGEEYGFAATDQRHRAVFNGIWQVGYGFQLSGLYFYGSGYRFATTYGGDVLNTGTTVGSARPRPANVGGGATPRNGIVGQGIHRVDMRLQRRFALVGRTAIDGMLEVFNAFNHENYGSYTTAESNSNYGRPSFNPNVAYQPRMLQVGFRLGF